jgi:hypothetical protein
MKTPLTASSATDCKDHPRRFQDLGSRKVTADFSGGTLSSDGGVLLVRQVDARLGVTASLAQCFIDRRAAWYVDHTVQQLLVQRIDGLALGSEDLNDHAWLRLDPLLASAGDKREPTGQDRFNPGHCGGAFAGVSTLNRLELSNNQQTRADGGGVAAHGLKFFRGSEWPGAFAVEKLFQPPIFGTALAPEDPGCDQLTALAAGTPAFQPVFPTD